MTVLIPRLNTFLISRASRAVPIQSASSSICRIALAPDIGRYLDQPSLAPGESPHFPLHEESHTAREQPPRHPDAPRNGTNSRFSTILDQAPDDCRCDFVRGLGSGEIEIDLAIVA